MNIVDRLETAANLSDELRAFRFWVLDRSFVFSLIELQTKWATRDRIIVLKMFEPCFRSAGVSLVFTDSTTKFSIRWVLDDKTALKLMSGREVDFSEIETIPYDQSDSKSETSN